MKKIISLTLLSMLILVMVIGCTPGTTNEDIVEGPGNGIEIAFADAGWDSAKFHNAVSGIIAEKVFGYTWREVPGSTMVLHEALIKGEIDVHMEVWTDNIASYDEDIEENRLHDLGVNFGDNNQGIYVPRYVIEGDTERGIDPIAPDLKTVKDLKKYADIFPDDEDKDMGRIYGAIPGWAVDEIMHNKYLHYGLDENFVYFRPGSEAALASALTSAYDRGQPIAAYYWEPTWLMGMYDFVLLEDEPYDENTYLQGATSLPSVNVVVGSSNGFAEDNPEFIEFLTKYETSSALTSEALAYMEENNADYAETAEWFLKKYDDFIDDWLTPDQAEKIRKHLE